MVPTGAVGCHSKAVTGRDIVVELIDGAAGADRDEIFTQAGWQAYLAGIQAAADTFIAAPG